MNLDNLNLDNLEVPSFFFFLIHYLLIGLSQILQVPNNTPQLSFLNSKKIYNEQLPYKLKHLKVLRNETNGNRVSQ